jgi:hypothetical protein
MGRRLKSIEYLSALAELNPENDNIDVSIELEDGKKYTLLVATPNNISWCMKNAGLDYFFSYPAPIFVKILTTDNVDAAIRAFCAEVQEEQFNAYAVLQSPSA